MSASTASRHSHGATALRRGAALVDALARNPHAFPHPVDRVEIVETHISWVLLAGEFAYKIKKPVKLPFLDFSALATRRFYCHEELRLNRRTAPASYLGVVAIAGDPPAIGAGGEVIEYAVKMRRFPRGALLSEVERAHGLDAATIDRLAARVAELHEAADIAPPDAKAESAKRATQPALDNFHQIEAIETRARERRRLDALRRWTQVESFVLAGIFAQRREQGFVRECHGDLHLGNVALLDGEPVPFDALEFSVPLRWGDVMSDVAFMVMDLTHRGRLELAARFLNAYLERTGDYEGLRVLRFYMVYRAMVRAKVDRIRAEQLRGDARLGALESFESHLGIARYLAGDGFVALVAMHGPSGSGKTHVSQRLLEKLGAVRIRSDVERKRMHGIAAGLSSGSAPGEGIYTQGEGRRVYARLADLALAALQGGFPVIVDATCLERSQRDLLAGVAARARAPFCIVSCAAPLQILRSRVAERAASGRDASEASLAVLGLQVAAQQPLGADELRYANVLDTTNEAAWQAAIDKLARGVRAKPELPT